MNGRCRAVMVVLVAVVFLPAAVSAAGVRALFHLGSPEGGPFPSDRFTRPDPSHNTGRRVDLPKPDCAVRVSDCQDIDVLNTLDGFNLQPRLSIPFSGPIDVTTVTSDTIFLISLGDTLTGGGAGAVVGINQIVWDPATATLHAESDALLDQHTRYVLVVTDGVRDAVGDPVEAGDFARFRHDANFGQTKDPVVKAYGKDLLGALARTGVAKSRIVSASVFTTQSITAVLEKIRDQIAAAPPPAADFALGPGGTRTVFPLAVVTSIQFQQQTGTAPTFTPSLLRLDTVAIVPGAVGTIAFGKYLSPDYQDARKIIPPIGSRTGRPVVQQTSEIHFNLFLPSGPMPPEGWPVVIFGHGGNDHKNSQPFFVAAILADHGLATIAINMVGSGGGPLGTLTVNRAGLDPVTVPAGSRGVDLDGDGTITPVEGLNASPRGNIIGSRDSFRQTAADLLQLVRVIQAGVDADGDGVRDLDPARLYYLGRSLGGVYGAAFLAVEPAVKAGALLVAPGSIIEATRFGVLTRGEGFAGIPGVGRLLASRVPSLINIGGVTFDENIPFRNTPPIINTVPGAMDLQRYFDNAEWAQQAGDAAAHARYLRTAPLPGPAGAPPLASKAIMLQFGKGDQTAPNPSQTAVVRAGDLADVTTFFRNDLAVAADPTIPKDPHLIALRVITAPQYARPAQEQVAVFLTSEGTLLIDPDGTDPFFEVPIALPLPEELNFIP